MSLHPTLELDLDPFLSKRPGAFVSLYFRMDSIPYSNPNIPNLVFVLYLANKHRFVSLF